MEEFLLYKQIENNLNSLFDIECPELSKEKSITTNKDDILNEFKKWYDFWSSKRPHITNPNIVMNETNKLLFIKIDICDNRILGIIKELESIGLYKEFKEKYFN